MSSTGTSGPASVTGTSGSVSITGIQGPMSVSGTSGSAFVTSSPLGPASFTGNPPGLKVGSTVSVILLICLSLLITSVDLAEI